MKINKGDIIQLKWDALDGYNGKKIIQDKHPFIVLRVNDDSIIACTVSSVNKVNYHFPHNAIINNWKECNLDKPSHAKTDNIANISLKDIHKKIGHLTQEDYIRVMTKYNRCPSSDFIVIEMINR